MYCSVISASLCRSGIFVVLSRLFRHVNVKVRRRAAATMGELLYYVSAQYTNQANASQIEHIISYHSITITITITIAEISSEGTGSNDEWKVPKEAQIALLRSLRAGEDDIVRHYAVKSIENVARLSSPPSPSPSPSICPSSTLLESDCFTKC